MAAPCCSREPSDAHLFEPFTRQFLVEAGIGPGMRVLDVGCGAGDVTALAASLVGASGEVVGIDASAQAVAAARERFGHVAQFLECNALDVSFDRPFDAVVGRLVLGHVARPLHVLRRLAAVVRRGGIVAFQEFDISATRSWPRAPVFEQCMEWMAEAFRLSGADAQAGLRLYSTFLNAGLPAPALRLDAVVAAGPGHLVYSVVAEAVRSMMPQITRFGIARAEDIGVETLRERMELEVAGADGVLIAPALVGAWTRV